MTVIWSRARNQDKFIFCLPAPRTKHRENMTTCAHTCVVDTGGTQLTSCLLEQWVVPPRYKVVAVQIVGDEMIGGGQVQANSAGITSKGRRPKHHSRALEPKGH